MIFMQLSNGGYAMYDGMTIDTVNAMLLAQGLTGIVIDQAVYQSATQRS